MTQRVVGTVLLLCVMACLAALDATPADSTYTGGLDHLFASDSTGSAVHIGAGAPTINMFRYMLGLVVVLGLLALLYYVLRRLTGRPGLGRTVSGMTVLAAYPLNNRQTLTLARLLDVVYVLAVSADRVTLIDKLDDPEAIEKLLNDTPTPGAAQFAGILEKFRKQAK